MKFEYKQNDQLIKAREQLRDLRRKNESNGAIIAEKRQVLSAARQNLDFVEAKHALGDASKTAVATAKNAFDRAVADLENSLQSLEPSSDALNYLFQQIERFQQEEEQENLARFKPIYQKAVKEFDAALAAAAAANANLAEVRASCTRIGISWPGPWEDFLGQYNHYQEWRDQAKRHALL